MEKEKFKNKLYTNDNLYILYGMNSETVDLIYLDPPFNSKRMYSAPVGSKAAGSSFKDMWTWDDVNIQYLETLAQKYPVMAKYITSVGEAHSKTMMAYLTYMAQRIIEMHRVLKDTGSIYLHCDPTASHYLKGLLDCIFGRNNFRNEIIWCYHGPGSPKMRQFNRKHDVIFWYSKSKTWTFNGDAVRMPFKDPNQSLRRAMSPTGKFDEEEVKIYREKGKIPETWWEIRIAARSKSEYTGYPTQKPLALLHRIIKASSNEGDIILDPFCGCATACVAAQQLDRKWIGIDIAEQSAGILVERLSDDAGLFQNFINTTIIPKRTDVEEIEPTKKSVKERLYKEQEGKCNGCGKNFDIENLEVDHIVAKAHGGGDYYENYQLLCGSCNRIKGARPMEYLRMKIEVRESMMKTRVIFGE